MTTDAKSMNTSFHLYRPHRWDRRLIHGLLLVAALSLWIPDARSQSTLANNNAQQGDFQGAETAHSWTVELPEDFNDLRLQVESPTASVLVFVIPEGQKRGIALKAMPGKGRPAATTGMVGRSIEVFTQGKLAKGRYTIQITPRDKQPAGKYSIKIVEPKLAQETPKTEGASTPSPSPTPQVNDNNNTEILAELKALREQVQAMERRLAALEAAQKQK